MADNKIDESIKIQDRDSNLNTFPMYWPIILPSGQVIFVFFVTEYYALPDELPNCKIWCVSEPDVLQNVMNLMCSLSNHLCPPFVSIAVSTEGYMITLTFVIIFLFGIFRVSL